MNELIEAAQAVIDATDTGDRWCAIAHLRAAVERAEKQEAVGFNEWFENLYHSEAHRGCTRLAWLAAQQALRDQIKEMLRQSSDWFEDDQMAQAKWLMEKIDATTE